MISYGILPFTEDDANRPVISGYKVTEQTPGNYTVGGDDIPAPEKSGNGWTEEHIATLTRISGTSDFVVFAEDWSDIDPTNMRKNVKDYGRKNWPWWECETSKDLGPDIGMIAIKSLFMLETVPSKDASEIEPWEIGGAFFTKAEHSFPTEYYEDARMITLIEQASIKAAVVPV